MRFIENTIYCGPEDPGIFQEIDRNLISFLLGDYMFIFYHDIERGIMTYRELHHSADKKLKELLENKDNLYEWFKDIVSRYVHANDRDEVLEMLNPKNHAGLLKDTKSKIMYYRWKNEEEYKYYKLSLFKLEDEDEEPKHVIMGTVCIDEEIRKKFEREKEMDFQLSLLDGLTREFHSVWLIRPDKRVEPFRNPDDKYTKELLKILPDCIRYDAGIQSFVDAFVAPEDKDRVEEALQFDKFSERVPETGMYTFTFKRICDHGSLVYLQICISRAVGTDGEVNYVLSTRQVDQLIRDEMKRREEYEKAMKERDIDGLTGIRNRYSFERKIKTYHKSDHNNIACIYIDVDGLHELNNSKGHAEGDELIKCVGMNILKYWGRENTFRIGGDEFVVFCFDTDSDKLWVTIEQFRERINKAGYSASIGWAIRDIEKLKVRELLKEAEDVMYNEKKEHYSGSNDRRKR